MRINENNNNENIKFITSFYVLSQHASVQL